MPFALQCALMHLAMIGYFWLADWYTGNLKESLPPWVQTIAGLAYLASLLSILLRVDLVAFSGDAGRQPARSAAPAWLFFVRTLAYYATAVGMPVLLFLYKDGLPVFLSAYLSFVYLAVLINHVDYALPSYSRYRRLIGEGKWGIMLASRS